MRLLAPLVVLLFAGCVIEPDAPIGDTASPLPANEPTPAAPYAGLQAREIKALSAEEVEGYRKGAGLGYAKPAELNSYPGPLHALEMSERLQLTDEQRAELDRLRAQMLSDVVPLGEQYLVIEGEIEQRFRDETMTPEALSSLLAESAKIESQIRYEHLAAHLATKALLTRHQVALYDEARGYGEADHNSHSHDM